MDVQAMDNLPTCRLEMETAQFRLLEMAKNGRLHFANHLRDTTDSFLRIRTLPNGRIYLPSIDTTARLMANTVGQMLFHGSFRDPSASTVPLRGQDTSY